MKVAIGLYGEERTWRTLWLRRRPKYALLVNSLPAGKDWHIITARIKDGGEDGLLLDWMTIDRDERQRP